MCAIGWSPLELDSWRAFEEGELPSVVLPTRWPFTLNRGSLPGQAIRWTPNVEMWEKGDRFVVRFELPGVRKEDIEIFTTQDTLTIGGVRSLPPDVKQDDYHRCEMCYGPFSRTLRLSTSIDPDAVEATYEHGMLEIHLIKTKDRVPIKINIGEK